MNVFSTNISAYKDELKKCDASVVLSESPQRSFLLLSSVVMLTCVCYSGIIIMFGNKNGGKRKMKINRHKSAPTASNNNINFIIMSF